MTTQAPTFPTSTVTEVISALEPLPDHVALREAIQQFCHVLEPGKAYVLRVDSLGAEQLDHVPDSREAEEIIGDAYATASSRVLHDHIMLVDDRALLRSVATINFLATALYNTGHPICGDVVVIPKR